MAKTSGHKIRRERAKQFWINVVKDSESMTPSEIAEKYQNPKTGKNYTREHIQFILKNADELLKSED